MNLSRWTRSFLFVFVSSIGDSQIEVVLFVVAIKLGLHELFLDVHDGGKDRQQKCKKEKSFPPIERIFFFFFSENLLDSSVMNVEKEKAHGKTLRFKFQSIFYCKTRF